MVSVRETAESKAWRKAAPYLTNYGDVCLTHRILAWLSGEGAIKIYAFVHMNMTDLKNMKHEKGFVLSHFVSDTEQ